MFENFVANSGEATGNLRSQIKKSFLKKYDVGSTIDLIQGGYFLKGYLKFHYII